DPAPGSGRQDEIGDLARQLQARLVPEKPEPEPQHDDEERHVYTELDNEEHFIDEPDGREPGFTMPELHAATDYDEDLTRPAPHAAPTDDDPFAELRDMQAEMPPPTPAIDMPEPPEQRLSSAILAIQLGAQEQLRHLPRARLMDLLQRYRDCLEQAAALYQGKLFTLNDGSSLLLFSSEHSGDDYLTHALCCGELLRALGHALQIEVADSGITLQLQLGLTRGDSEIPATQAELLLSEAAQDALALAQHSRNLL